MKILFVCSLFILSYFSIMAQDIPKWEKNAVSEKQYTYKAVETCDKKFNYGRDTVAYYIGLKNLPLTSDTSEIFIPIYELCTYYWSKNFDRYSNEEKISVLEELLEYENDTDLSGTKVCRYGFVEPDTPCPITVSYTMQTEALFIITLLTMSESSLAYCPYPVLVNTKTNKEINNNPKEIKKVFNIYKKWINENSKNGFINFAPPLYGTKYKWYAGTEYRINYRIDDLHAPGIIIGKCKD